jgi:hypothetical protein
LLDAARDDGQAEAEARRSVRLGLRRLDLLKFAEEALELAGRDAAARVAHDDLDSDLF